MSIINTLYSDAGVIIQPWAVETIALTLAGADNIAIGTILARNTTSQKAQLFVSGGAVAGNGVPRFILLDNAISTAAGDVSVRVVRCGIVRLESLVVDAGTAIGGAITDLLSQTGIIAVSSPSATI